MSKDPNKKGTWEKVAPLAANLGLAVSATIREIEHHLGPVAAQIAHVAKTRKRHR